MAIKVSEVAKLSGVSVRTLHWYDEIGLLKPTYYGENGYRYYEEADLLKLQQILLYRELDFPLSKIKKILESSDFVILKALKAHKKEIQTRINNSYELVDTIDKTIEHIKGKQNMELEELYNGFTPEKQKEYEQYIEENNLYPEDIMEECRRKAKHFTPSDHETIKNEGKKINLSLVEAIENGKTTRDVQPIIRKHFDWIKQFWTPNKKRYIELGEMYVNQPDFRKFYDQHHPRLAIFVRDAMKLFAEENLV